MNLSGMQEQILRNLPSHVSRCGVPAMFQADRLDVVIDDLLDAWVVLLGAGLVETDKGGIEGEYTVAWRSGAGDALLGVVVAGTEVDSWNEDDTEQASVGILPIPER